MTEPDTAASPRDRYETAPALARFLKAPVCTIYRWASER